MENSPVTAAIGAPQDSSPPAISAGNEMTVLAAIEDGGRTHHIAARLGVPMRYSKLRRCLLRLERDGWIERDDRLSYVNSIWWRPIP